MSGCPYDAGKLRPELPPLDARLALLPLDERGYPVPFFVAWVDGKPEFRAMDPAKFKRCVKDRLCWVCGTQLGKHLAFVIGPMCAVTGTTSEPPSHRSCAEWSMKGCPFLSRPHMVRREDEFTESCTSSGEMVKRNPGVICLWITRQYSLFADAQGRALIRVGEALETSWWREGRPATRAEVIESLNGGLPLLRNACRGADDLRSLMENFEAVGKLLPAEVPA